MEPDLIEKLGRKAFQQHFRRIGAPHVKGRLALVGFDTEYTSDGAELLSVQLTHHGRELYKTFEPGEFLTLESLGGYARELMAEEWAYMDRVYLISYWSTAELSMIKSPWWRDARVKRVHSAEVYNVDWQTPDKKRLMVYDLWHFFFPKPLRVVAKAFGFEKLDWDRAHVTRADLDSPRFREYAMRDSHIAEGIMRQLRGAYRKFGVDILATKTPAGASMAVYRSRYMKQDAEQRDLTLRRLAMRANKGGIAEAFACGRLEADPGEVWQQWDADSLYPNAAINLGALPFRPPDWRHAQEEPPPGTEGVCKVRFTFPEGENYPCLPVVVEGGGMGFPSAGVSYCTVAEARVAQSFGAALDWQAVYYYHPAECDSSFQRFMLDMVREKKAADASGDQARRIVSKNVMNTGIGKMSQRRRGLDVEELKKMAEEMGVPVELLLDPSFKLDEKSRQEPGECWMPEFHALILGKARALMWPLIRASRSLVTSTDSIICGSATARAIGLRGADVDASATYGPLGLKLEGQGDVLTIVRQRLYSLGWRSLIGWGDGKRKVAHHAVHAGPDISEALIANTPLGEQRKYATRKKGTLRDAIRGRRAFGEFYSRPMTYNATWGGKRQLLPDGTTRPWENAAAWKRALLTPKE